jgi:hypothetical protein
MDPTPRVWFHALKENSMKPPDRLTNRANFRRGIIVFAAVIVVLALSSTSARRVGSVVLAASVGVPSATGVAAENNGTAVRPFRIDLPEADLSDLRRGLSPLTLAGAVGMVMLIVCANLRRESPIRR